MHPLDLPVLTREPPSNELWSVMDALKVSTRNFDTPPPLEPHVVSWLSRLVSSGLYWLDGDDAEALCNAASNRLAQSCGISARSNAIRLLDIGSLEVRLHEPGFTNDNIGHKTWGSCLILANRLVSEPHHLNGSVLELGSGTGVCGIISAHLGHPTHLTDLPQIVENLKRNISENENLTTAPCTAGVLDWSKPVSPGSFDTVLISDPVYSPAAPTQLGETLRILQIPRLLLQLPLRPKFEDLREQLYNAIELCGYSRDLIETEDGRDDFGPSQYVFTRWSLASE